MDIYNNRACQPSPVPARNVPFLPAAYLLDIILRQRSGVFKLLAKKCETHPVGRKTVLVLNLRFHIANHV